MRPNTGSDEVEDHKPDLWGSGLLIAGIATFQIMLDRGQVNGWFESREICVLALLAAVTNGLFFLWQFLPQNKHPLINAYHIFDRGMFAGAVLALFLGIGLSGSTYLLYQYLREVETHSALQTGIIMSPEWDCDCGNHVERAVHRQNDASVRGAEGRFYRPAFSGDGNVFVYAEHDLRYTRSVLMGTTYFDGHVYGNDGAGTGACSLRKDG